MLIAILSCCNLTRLIVDSSRNYRFLSKKGLNFKCISYMSDPLI